MAIRGLAKKPSAESTQPTDEANKPIEPLTIRHDPVVDAVIDSFVKENPTLMKRLELTPKETLVRKYLWKQAQKKEYGEAVAFRDNKENAAKVDELKTYIGNKPVPEKRQALLKMITNLLRERKGIKVSAE